MDGRASAQPWTRRSNAPCISKIPASFREQQNVPPCYAKDFRQTSVHVNRKKLPPPLLVTHETESLLILFIQTHQQKLVHYVLQ